MTTEQLPIEGTASVTTKKPKKALEPFERSCNECGKTYQALTAKSQYCGGRCAKRAQRKALNGVTDNQPQTMNTPQKSTTETAVNIIPDEKPDKEKRPRSIRPKFSNLPADVSIGVMLLEKELDRMERMYEEERSKRKKIQGKYEELKERTKDEKHAQALAGIEAAKPDIMERIISGVSQLPPQILEGLAPAIGRLMNKVVPPEGVAGQLQGSADIDPMSKELLTWLAAQPEQTRELLFGVIGTLMGLDQNKLASTLSQFINLLKSGSTLSGADDQNIINIQPPLPYDKAMYNLQ